MIQYRLASNLLAKHHKIYTNLSQILTSFKLISLLSLHPKGSLIKYLTKF